MGVEEIKDFLRRKKGYVKFGKFALHNMFMSNGVVANVEDCEEALRIIRSEDTRAHNGLSVDTGSSFVKAFFNTERIPDIVSSQRTSRLNKNVLVIGDLHLPFSLKGYLEHCVQTYHNYKCNEVVFIGDIIDNHATSYHETDPDGYSAGYELKLAINQVKDWYKYFPKATVIIGNHDRLIMRKAQTSGLSKMWIKDYADVLGVPGWNFTEQIEIDDVLYIHGEGGTARTRARRDLQSVVQGHLHTQAYVDWIVGSKFKIFGCQVGCGVDHKTYAMTYAKEFAKPAIGCAVVTDNGTMAINVMMNL